MLGLGDAEESDVSRNLLSLAEVLLMSVIDKRESKHAPDEAMHFPWLTTSLISCHSTRCSSNQKFYH